ncbi:MAG TPA: hypothetical protein V6C72_15310 [Chroococcales cyanobacterium]
MGWTTSASTGILFLDYILRPFLKLALKFPTVGMLFLFAIYGFIAYITVKSAFLEDH